MTYESTSLTTGFGGAQRAAAVLLAMGKPAASQVLRHLTQDELREVTLAAAHLGTVSATDLESIVEDFTTAFSSAAPLLGDEIKARALVEDSLPPEQIADFFLSGGSSDRGADVWKAVSETPDTTLATFLQGEHSLIVTYTLSRLPSDLSGRVVGLLPRDLRNEVLVRLLSPPQIAPGALPLFETALGDSLLGGVATEAGDDHRARIAEILNSLAQEEVEEVMRAMGAVRPQDAKVVRRMLFSFNDLPRLSQRARSLLFDKVSSDLVVLALRGTEADFREAVLSAMASRSRRLVESELSNPSSLPPVEIDKSRRQIVKLVLEMAQRGEIDLPSVDDAEPDVNAA